MAADVRGALTHQEPSPGVGATGISRGDRPSAGELRLWGPREGPGQRLSPDSASSLKRAEHGMRDEVVGSTHVHPTTKLDLDVSGPSPVWWRVGRISRVPEPRSAEV